MFVTYTVASADNSKKPPTKATPKPIQFHMNSALESSVAVCRRATTPMRRKSNRMLDPSHRRFPQPSAAGDDPLIHVGSLGVNLSEPGKSGNFDADENRAQPKDYRNQSDESRGERHDRRAVPFRELPLDRCCGHHGEHDDDHLETKRCDRRKIPGVDGEQQEARDDNSGE